MQRRRRRVVEAASAAVVGGALAGGVGSLLGLVIPAAGIGAANGAIAGWRRVYNWRRAEGVAAFVLDSTWSLPMTAAGLFANAVGMSKRDAGYVPELSVRQNRQVYRRGFMPRKGFAITLGNVVSGAADVERPRRARLITDHEDVHIWQARWFGPLYPVLYGGWMVVGGAAGALVWMLRWRDRGEQLTRTIESAAYYVNPFEWWAYSRDDNWPPSGKLVGFGWRQPCCKPLPKVRPNRPAPHSLSESR